MKVTTSLRAGKGELSLPMEVPKKELSLPMQVIKKEVSLPFEPKPIKVPKKRHVQVGPKDRPSLRDLGCN